MRYPARAHQRDLDAGAVGNAWLGWRADNRRTVDADDLTLLHVGFLTCRIRPATLPVVGRCEDYNYWFYQCQQPIVIF